jgi:hypothetical protein
MSASKRPLIKPHLLGVKLTAAAAAAAVGAVVTAPKALR